MDELVRRLIARGPKLRTLQFLASADMNTAAGYGIMFELRPRLFLARVLTNIGALDVRRQGLVLVLCRRFMDPATLPLWPAHKLMLQSDTKVKAVRLVAVMPSAYRAAMLPTLVHVSAVADCHAAIDIVQDLSERVEYAYRVARAVESSTYRPYMRMLGVLTLWRLVPFLRENDAAFALCRLLRDNPARALAAGAWTHLIATQRQSYITLAIPSHLPYGLHQSIYSMYLYGTPTHQLERAQQLEPDATRALCHRWPTTVGREAKWLRRRHIVLCARRSGKTKVARLWKGIASMPCLLRIVVAYV